MFSVEMVPNIIPHLHGAWLGERTFNCGLEGVEAGLFAHFGVAHLLEAVHEAGGEGLVRDDLETCVRAGPDMGVEARARDRTIAYYARELRVGIDAGRAEGVQHVLGD